MIWNKTKECMSRDQIVDLQGKRLVELVKYMYQNVEFYKKKMQGLGIEPRDIRGINDLDKLPFMTKEDLLGAYPTGVFAVPGSKIIRYHASGYREGMNTIVGYTQNDIDVWKECMVRSISMANLGEKDTIQVAYSNGFCADVCAEKVGAAVISMPDAKISALVTMMRQLRVTGIISTSSYIMRMAYALEERQLRKRLCLRAAICGGELWPETVRKRVQGKLGIKIYDTYDLSELTGFGLACECECQNGLHIQEDFFRAEVVDPNTLAAVPKGMKGELVFTTLQREGIPLIRYRTMNVAKINYEKCECGRTTARIDKICDRTDDILLIRGNSVFAFRIEDALLALQRIDASYRVYIRKKHNLDVVDIYIKSNENSGIRLQEREESVRCRVANAVRSIIGMEPKIQFAENASVGFYGERKVIIIDERQR